MYVSQFTIGFIE